MPSRVDHAKEWMRDGDRLVERASARLLNTSPATATLDLQLAAHDYTRAAAMYLTGAVEYQHGPDGVRRAAASVDDTLRLVQHLDGRLRLEADTAWRDARRDLLPSQQTRASGLEPSRTFAASLRDRLAHAVPELFDQPGPSPVHLTTRGRSPW